MRPASLPESRHCASECSTATTRKSTNLVDSTNPLTISTHRPHLSRSITAQKVKLPMLIHQRNPCSPTLAMYDNTPLPAPKTTLKTLSPSYLLPPDSFPPVRIITKTHALSAATIDTSIVHAREAKRCAALRCVETCQNVDESTAPMGLFNTAVQYGDAQPSSPPRIPCTIPCCGKMRRPLRCARPTPTAHFPAHRPTPNIFGPTKAIRDPNTAPAPRHTGPGNRY